MKIKVTKVSESFGGFTVNWGTPRNYDLIKLSWDSEETEPSLNWCSSSSKASAEDALEFSYALREAAELAKSMMLAVRDTGLSPLEALRALDDEAEV